MLDIILLSIWDALVGVYNAYDEAFEHPCLLGEVRLDTDQTQKPKHNISKTKINPYGQLPSDQAYTLMLELLQTYKYLLDTHATRSNAKTSLDRQRNRIINLQKKSRRVRNNVDSSSLPKRRGMLRVLDQRAQVVEKAQAEIDQQLSTHQDAEHGLNAARADLEDQVASVMDLSQGLPDRLASHLQSIHFEDTESVRRLTTIEEEVEEIRQRVAQSPATR
ncbi:hypothetical protein OHC33_008136 [Knufia fluminis]|uniref:Uncharacterized protein n=1 Tax=Knufia fluminis TaxID=191047 RepID=A0AAN8EG58_9EURO|nr:hypothetical protein OHC33_008136 [Knufia fluminis]